MQIVEDRHALGEDGTAGEGETILRKISGGNAFGARDGAVVEGLQPARIFITVDLPVPLAPTRPMRRLGVISQSASSNRSLWP